MKRFAILLLTLAIAVAACGSDTPQPDTPAAPTTEPTLPPANNDADTPEPEAELPASSDDVLFPDVVNATATLQADGTFSFSATLSSPYDSPERYADAWRILAPDGTQLGIRELGHDHASEQPFTRSVKGIEIPADVTVVTVQGRDQVSGWGGATVEVVLER